MWNSERKIKTVRKEGGREGGEGARGFCELAARCGGWKKEQMDDRVTGPATRSDRR